MSRRMLISGSSGLIGRKLSGHFKKQGDTVVKLVRNSSSLVVANDILWDPTKGIEDESRLEGLDVVIHLAGKNIASGRWSEDLKKQIYKSRVQGTKVLCTALSGLKRKPSVILCASATGFYGDRDPSEEITESDPKGEGFRCDLCDDWEAASHIAKDAGIRVVNMRIGIVLAKEGGTLKRMLPIFKAGLGGKLGSGDQVMSWVALREFPGMIEHLIDHAPLEGPVNFVSGACSNREFTKILAKVLKRPAILPVPAFLLKLLYGQMAEELLLSGARIIPEKLIRSSYNFKFTDLEKCLSSILKGN